MMKRSLLLPLLLVVAILFGCTVGPSAEGAARLATPAQRAVRGMKKDGSSIGTRTQVAEEYLAALRSFCVRTAREGLPKGEEENALLSPVSLYLATAVLAGAAEGGNEGRASTGAWRGSGTGGKRNGQAACQHAYR